MEFGWLNLSGFVIVALMMAPNILYALRNKGAQTEPSGPPAGRLVLILEQLGRYGCIALMVLPLGVGKFGFSSAEASVLWGALCIGLLAAYYVFWALYFRKPSPITAMLLAILPAALFILRGVFLRHWLLAAFGVLFAVGHITITWVNNREA